MKIKQHLYNQCKSTLNSRLLVLQKKITDIKNALQSETKSSAGDKHETGRAMLQLEHEKTGQQLAEIEKQYQLLYKINPKITQNTIALGSVVFTSQGNFFLAVSIGKMRINEHSFFAISPATPIGKMLIGKHKDDTFLDLINKTLQLKKLFKIR